MSTDTLETAFRRFEKPPHVEGLSRIKFSLVEVADAIEQPPQRIREYHKSKIQLVSDPNIGSKGRSYHLLDIYVLALVDVFDRTFNGAARQAMIVEFAQLLLGDAVSLQEGRDRRADFIVERERILKRGTLKQREKSDRMLFEMFQARRKELQADIFAAMPLWWARDPDQHFILFVAKNGQFFQLIADRTVNGGKLDAEPFIKAGMVFAFDATGALMEIDRRLEKILKERDENSEA